MAKTIPFKLITPSAVVFDGEAELVIATGTEGEIGILPSHAPYLTALKPGVLRANVVKDAESARLELATSAGFLQALPGRVIMLVDAAVAADAVDPVATTRERDEAIARQQAAGGDPGPYAREQERIDFAVAKLAVSGH